MSRPFKNQRAMNLQRALKEARERRSGSNTGQQTPSKSPPSRAKPTKTKPRRAKKPVNFHVPYEHEEILKIRIRSELLARKRKAENSDVSGYYLSISKQLAKENFKDARERFVRAEKLLEEFLNKNTM